MSAGRMIYLAASAVCLPTQATAAEFARAPGLRPGTKEGMGQADEKRAAVAGGSKCETGRCQSPEDGWTPPLMIEKP
jgi:hypothetical protein